MNKKQKPKVKLYKSHHERFPGYWMDRVDRQYIHPERRLYPNLSQLDKDRS